MQRLVPRLVIGALALTLIAGQAAAVPRDRIDPHPTRGDPASPDRDAKSRTAVEGFRLPDGARVLILSPAVFLSAQTAGGVTEARPEWNRQARANILGEVQSRLTTRNLAYTVLDPDTVEPGRAADMLTLLRVFTVAMSDKDTSLPAHDGDRLNWTMGPGVAVLASAYNADYVLVSAADGVYSSAGLLVSQAFVSVHRTARRPEVAMVLVDLKTGQAMWMAETPIKSGQDVRRAEGARALMLELLAEAPL